MSIINEFKRWFPSLDGTNGQGDATVRQDSGGRDEEGRRKVKDVVKRLDNLKIGTPTEGKTVERVPGSNTDARDTDNSMTQKRSNNMSSGSDTRPQCMKGIIKVLPVLSDSEKHQNNQEILNLTPSKFLNKSKGETQKGKECSVAKPGLPGPLPVNNPANGSHCPAGLLPHSGTLSGLDADPVIDTQAPGSTSLGDKHRQPTSESGPKLNADNRQHRSSSFPPPDPTTATAAAAAAKGKSLPAKLDPEDCNEEAVVRWKKEGLVSALIQAFGNSSGDGSAPSAACPPSPSYFSACATPVPASPTSITPPNALFFPTPATTSTTSPPTSITWSGSRSSVADSFISAPDTPSPGPDTPNLGLFTRNPVRDTRSPVRDSPPDSPETSRWKISSKFSIRKVSNAILNTVAQLFGQILPSKSRSLSNSSISDGTQGDTQEAAEEVVMRRKPSRPRDVKIQEKDDDVFVDADMRGLDNKETHRKIYVYEEDTTQDNSSGFSPGDILSQGANRVRDIVRMIEDNMRANRDTAKQADTKRRRMENAAIENMRLPLYVPVGWDDDRKQRPENEPIKEEISKAEGGGGGNQQDANTLITQSATTRMKENEDQTGIEEPDKVKEAEWKLFAAQSMSQWNRRGSSNKENGDEGNKTSEQENGDEEKNRETEIGKEEEQRIQKKNEDEDEQGDTETSEKNRDEEKQRGTEIGKEEERISQKNNENEYEQGDKETSENRDEEKQKGDEKEKENEIKILVDEETESDTDEESVIMRSQPRARPTSFYRYSTLGPRGRQMQNTIYPFCVVRPRTVIISLGVCTETKYINDSFGDGVSESESEDEEDISPAPIPAPAPTPTRQRPTTPSRTSRPHSPLSDMDTESKRNSQAVSTEPSDLEDHSSVTTSDIECPEPPVVDSRKDKAYRIALELLHTERTYVKVLHLIDQEFQFRVDNENRAHHMFPPDVILHMFSNIKSIYKLHHDFLLPQLEERMAQWEHNRRIGDIMKNFAPFLKMYTEYVRNFDNAMTLINQWQAKCPRFATIMDDIHSMEVCGSLTLQHHMLSPVQRIPRYEMLLRDYLKKLPEDSPDCHDTEKALHLVSTAANHANDAMKKIDKFEKLLEIQESLGGAEDLVSPTRELIKEGKIIKISARSGDHQERYIFLLTDLLLLCSPKLMSGRVMSGPQYRLRAKYHVENLIIQEGDNLETANTFYIKDNNKSVELYTQTIEEKEQWLDAFIRAIHETSQRKSSLKLHFNPNQRVIDVDLGQKQPMLIRSDSVTKCMECGSQFTMVRRKHHCRACGAVVCSKCSSFKASLAYECGKSVRVCRTCHATLQELSSSTATPSPEIDDGDECSMYSAKEQLDLPFRNRGVLEVSAKTSGAVMQGFLQLKTHRKTWVKRWFALHTDFVLYSFKCEADDQALTATPVPGFTVTHLQGTRNESGINDKEKERAFKLHHAKKQYIFQAASKDESQRWVAALKKASQAELPSPVQ